MLDVKLPLFIQQEIGQIQDQLSPEKITIGMLLSEQAAYNKRAISVQGTVVSVISVDEINEQTVSTWFLNLPTTVETSASATYFYVQDDSGEKILVKYPADLDVSAPDSVNLAGMFSAYGVSVQSKGLFRSKQEELVNPLGEPFIGAITVENQTRQKLEYIRRKK